MKHHLIRLIGPGLVAVGLQLNAADARSSGLAPAMFELPASTSGEEYVEVNISRGLIGLVNRAVAAREPEISAVLDELRGIRVRVVSLDESNRRTVLARFENIRTELSAAQWESVATVKDGDTTVQVMLKLKGDEAVEGLVVQVIENDGQAVLVGIDGNIRPEQVGMLGERFDIEPLKGIGLKLQAQ
jgi:hypothetical protein